MATAAANTARIQADLRTVESAVITYYAVKGVYPDTLDELAEGSERFLEELPQPVHGSCYIDGEEISVNGWKYALNDAHRATFNGMTAESFHSGKK